MSRKIFTFFKQCLQKYSLREYLNKSLIFNDLFFLFHNQFLEPFRGKSLQLALLVDEDVIGLNAVYAFDDWQRLLLAHHHADGG